MFPDQGPDFFQKRRPVGRPFLKLPKTPKRQKFYGCENVGCAHYAQLTYKEILNMYFD